MDGRGATVGLRRRLWATLLASLVGASGAAAGSGPQAAAASAIEGPTWRLTRLGTAGGEPSPGTSRTPTVRFVAGQVEGFSGCNGFDAGYRVEPGHVVVGSPRATTRACVGQAAELETAFLRAFAGTLAYELADGVLTLTSTTGDTLAFRAEAPPRLAGVTWNVASYYNGRNAVVTPLAGSRLTLSFGEASLQGHAGCNDFRASVRVEGDAIRIGAPAATRKSCVGDELMRQENDFLAALPTATTWLIHDGRLELRSARGTRVLTATLRAAARE